MQLNGYLFESRSSVRHVATLEVDTESFSLLIDNIQTKSGLLTELSFSDRIGNTPRRILFADGSLFETPDNNLVDEMAAIGGIEYFLSKYVHILESKWRWVFASVILTVLLGYFAFSTVLPWGAQKLASNIPANVNKSISKKSLDFLDYYIFEQSELNPAKKNELQQNFTKLISSLPISEFNYRLYFRKMKGEANALSLTAGDIVLTDELIRLAENPNQINAILLHEIGHTHNRHGLQQIVRASFMAVFISTVTGDLSGLEELVVALPIFLLEGGYSRSDENEADGFMFEQMQNLQMNPMHFANILNLITQDEYGMDGTVLKYFSSHPETSQRIENATRKSQEFLSNEGSF